VSTDALAFVVDLSCIAVHRPPIKFYNNAAKKTQIIYWNIHHNSSQ